jgi:hypothetical protein
VAQWTHSDAVKNRCSEKTQPFAQRIRFGFAGVGATSFLHCCEGLSVVPNPTGWCVDFGAYDGQVCCNTFNLVAVTTSSVNHARQLPPGGRPIVNDRDCEAHLGATLMSTGPWRSRGVDVRRTANALGTADIEIGHVEFGSQSSCNFLSASS